MCSRWMKEKGVCKGERKYMEARKKRKGKGGGWEYGKKSRINISSKVGVIENLEGGENLRLNVKLTDHETQILRHTKLWGYCTCLCGGLNTSNSQIFT